MKAIHAVNAVLWQPGEQTRVSQTDRQKLDKLEHWSANPRLAVDMNIYKPEKRMHEHAIEAG